MRRVAWLCLALLLLAACGDKKIVAQPYDRAPVPAVPDRTMPVPTGDAPLPDGQYWSEDVVVVDGFRLRFALSQAFFGPTCATQLSADACTGDHGLVTDPSREIVVAPEGRAPISVAATDQKNYAVTADEIVNLVGGGTPSSDAPAGFAYHPYPYLLTVRTGEVVSMQQIWTPDP
jgi:hypothetical protein